MLSSPSSSSFARMESLPQVFVRAFTLRGISADVIRKYPKSKIFIQSDLGAVRIETQQQPLGTSSRIDEVNWTNNLGLLKWDVSSSDIQNIKAIQPKLKLNIMVQPAKGKDGVSIPPIAVAYVLLDMRDLMKEIKQQWCKVYGMINGELLLSAKINAKIHMGEESNDVMQAVIRSESDDESNDKFFMVTIALNDYHNIQAYTAKQRDEDERNKDETDREYWFAYSIFNQTYHSDKFTWDTVPRKVRDTIKLNSQFRKLRESFPFQLCLCTSGSVLAQTDITIDFRDDENDELNMLPLKKTSSYTLESSKEGKQLHNESIDVPSVNVTVELDVYQPQYMTHHTTTTNTDTTSIDYADDVFDDEDINETREREVHFHLNDSVDAVDGNSVGPKGKLSVGSPSGAGGETSGEEDDDDNEADRLLRHFRVSIDVRSITGLKRPAHIGIHFVYPFFGTSNAVRTQPQWVMANTESKLDGASATYECCMSKESLLDTLQAHPLKVSMLSRSQLGHTALGDVLVDMSVALNTKPNSYRCPLIKKSFKDMKDYNKHRHTMLALKSAGRIEHAPPADPVIVKVHDSNYSVSSTGNNDTTANARVRVVVIIEDIGTVGPELCADVKLGYKMHNGGVYGLESDEYTVSDDAHYAETTMKNAAYAVHDPLQRKDLTDQQRVELEALRVDWEGWRRAAETQWKDALREKEVRLRAKLQAEANAGLADRADDLRRAHEEAGRLEVRLRTAIDSVDRQKNQLSLKEEEVGMKLAQKTAELQLLQRRVREEAKIKIDAEANRVLSLQLQLTATHEALERTNKRLKDTEKDFDAYRIHARNTSEAHLRDEVAKLRALHSEAQLSIERERRCKVDAELEKEHFRSQMHRLAAALKREREKNGVLARQELEQLRLEFLAREERYVLDGDRDELRNIRYELASLRNHTLSTPNTGTGDAHVSKQTNTDDVGSGSSSSGSSSSSDSRSGTSSSGSSGGNTNALMELKQTLSDLYASGRYTDADPLIAACKREIVRIESASAIDSVV